MINREDFRRVAESRKTIKRRWLICRVLGHQWSAVILYPPPYDLSVIGRSCDRCHQFVADKSVTGWVGENYFGGGDDEFVEGGLDE
jgi:hypothetical protein